MNNTVTESKLKKNKFTLLLLVLSGALIYALPYFKGYYYDVYTELFNLNATQYASLGSVFGLVGIFGYLFGGFISDKFSTRKLMVFSLIGTGLLGFVLLTFPPYPVVFAIHALWGVTSLLTYWSPLVKATRSIANPDEQGKAFGFMEGGRGIVNIIHASGMLALFSVITRATNSKTGLITLIAGYSVINIVLGILLFVKFKDPYEPVKETNGKKELINIPLLKKLLKMPTTWLAVIIIFTSYTMMINYYYFTPYTTEVFGATTVIAAAFTIFSQYCRPIGSGLTGVIADKIGSSNILAICFVIMIVGIFGITYTPGSPSLIYIVLAFAGAIYASMYGIQAMHYAILEEGDYPLETTGTLTSIICTLGYSAEFITPLIGGVLLDKFPGATGYRYFFTFLGVLAIIGLVSTFAWMYLTKEKRAEIARKRKGITVKGGAMQSN